MEMLKIAGNSASSPADTAWLGVAVAFASRRAGCIAIDGPGVQMRNDKWVVRPLDRSDELELLALFLRLESSCRFSRFSFLATDHAIAQHVRRMVSQAMWVAGVFVGGHLRGVLELYDTSEPGVAEAAFVVERSWRRRGLGLALMDAARTWADQAGIGTLRMVFSPTNTAMRRLADKGDAVFAVTPDEIFADVAAFRTTYEVDRFVPDIERLAIREAAL